MSQKYYEMIAARIARAYLETDNSKTKEVLNFMILDLCSDFKADNPRFDAHRFNNACKGIVHANS